MITRYHKRKIIGGNLLKNVVDRVKGVIQFGSKILKRIPTGVKSLVIPAMKAVLKKTLNPETKTSKLRNPETELNDESRAILSNLISGSGFRGFKKYIYP